MTISPKARLLEIVEELTGTLKRPVCSRDLLAFLTLHPERHTQHMKRVGQVLLKSAIPRGNGIPHLHIMGKIANRSYYATADTPEMRQAFHLERHRHQIDQTLDWRMADAVERLRGTEYEALGLNAAAGFIMEMSPLSHISGKLTAELDRLRVHRLPEFVGTPFDDFISRSEAKKRIIQAATIFHEDVERAECTHTNKLLASWRWPQSNLFSPSDGEPYALIQIQWMCDAHFGPEVDVGAALLTCSRFGKGRSS